MKPKDLRRIESLCKTLQAEGYKVVATTRAHSKQLILVIELKNGDIEQIEKFWGECRQIEGG